MRGPKPKPVALKLLEGVRKCRVNRDEPALSPAESAPPEWLGDLGKEHWNELFPLLSRASVMTEGDRAALAQLCDDYETIRKSRDNSMVKAGDDLKPVRLVLNNADKARNRYMRALCEFGLTPSSRSRIRVGAEKPRDELESFIAKEA